MPHPLVEASRRAARAVLLNRAVDVTAEVGGSSCLVIAPHPDDETLGCGATIARARAGGAAVTVVFVSDGARSHSAPDVTPEVLAKIRHDEAVTAVGRLGANIPLRFLDLPDGRLTSELSPMTTRLREVIEDAAADVVLSPSIDEPPPDHSAVGVAVRHAVAESGVTCRLWEYPVWLWSRWPLPASGSPLGRLAAAARTVAGAPVVRVDAGPHLETKRFALAAHETQMTVYRPDAGWVPLPASMLDLVLTPQELFFPVAY